MSSNLLKYIDLLPIQKVDLTVRNMTAIILRCFPYVSDLLLLMHFDRLKDSPLDQQIFFFSIVAKFYDMRKMSVGEAAHKIEHNLKLHGKLWTEEQKETFGDLPLDSRFYSAYFTNADLNILLRHLSLLQNLMSDQMHYFIKREAEVINALVDKNGAQTCWKNDMREDDKKYTWFSYTGVSAYKKLTEENFFATEDEALTFLFDTTRYLQVLSQQDKITIAAFFK